MDLFKALISPHPCLERVTGVIHGVDQDAGHAAQGLGEDVATAQHDGGPAHSAQGRICFRLANKGVPPILYMAVTSLVAGQLWIMGTVLTTARPGAWAR